MRYRVTIRAGRAATLLGVLALAACAGSGRGTDLAGHPGASPARVAEPVAFPTAVDLGGGEIGNATYYGIRHHGRRTASGEVFDRHGMTAAHARLPLGTEVRVTNPATGRSVVVRVNDRCRCPKAMIDLSEGAARAIGMLATTRVRLERL